MVDPGGLSALDTVFVHTQPIMIPRSVKVVSIPHGPYPFPPSARSPSTVRRNLSIPEGAIVLVMFGYQGQQEH